MAIFGRSTKHSEPIIELGAKRRGTTTAEYTPIRERASESVFPESTIILGKIRVIIADVADARRRVEIMGVELLTTLTQSFLVGNATLPPPEKYAINA